MSTPWEVFVKNELVARFREPLFAAAFVSAAGDGAVVKYHGRVVWVEGAEAWGAQEQDATVDVLSQRADSADWDAAIH